MLQLIIPDSDELWDEKKEEFVYRKGQTLQLEHSLVSLAKWESKWCVPFLSKKDKTLEETLDYIKCMTITQNVNPEVYLNLTQENVDAVNAYINAPMTATYFSNEKATGPSNEQVTSEIIYYWMIALNIPPEYQKWHLNRLLTLIKVCNIKNQPPKKHSRREIMRRNAALNAERRKRLGSRG